MIEAVADSDVLLVEVADLDDSGAARREFDARAYSSGLDPLLDRVDPGERPLLSSALDAAQIDAEQLAGTESWAAALQIGNAKRCFSTGNGVDRQLLDLFSDVRSLESFSAQFALFDSLTEDAQSDLLVSVASETGCAASEARIEAWLTGNDEALQHSLVDGFRGNAELERVLNGQRNAVFAYDIGQLGLSEPDTVLFVAVGAGHMLGPDGLPALLEARGYTVTRIQ